MIDFDKLLDLPLWYLNFLMAITFHEAAHAWVAYLGGDATAYEGGQITLNPVPHVQREPVGTVIVPLITFFLYDSCLGWASAPYNMRWRIRHPRRAGLMALAGPVSNMLLAIFAGLILNLGLGLGFFFLGGDQFLGIVSHYSFWGTFAEFIQIMFFLNLLLFAFNMLPIPPLDGYGVLGLCVSESLDRKLFEIAQNPNFQFGGLIVAWYLFPYVFEPCLHLAISVFALSLSIYG